jgi:hypothetical protein
VTNAVIAQARAPVMQEETLIRSTIDPVRHDPVPELPAAPEWNAPATDSAPLSGPTAQRQVSGDVTPSESYVPDYASADALHNAIIDAQVASSGTAAAREATGQWGHGTAEWTNSIDPLIRDGAFYGNDYFVVNPQEIQEGAGAYMTPVVDDREWYAVMQDTATRASRDAAQGSMIGQWFSGA